MLCAQAGLSVQYTLDANDLQNFTITFIALACACAVFAVGFAVLRTWSWAKRSTSNSIGVVVVLKFVAYAAAALSNLWLLLTAGFSIWYYCFYKVCSCFYSSASASRATHGLHCHQVHALCSPFGRRARATCTSCTRNSPSTASSRASSTRRSASNGSTSST